jgi:hypothetical protein
MIFLIKQPKQENIMLSLHSPAIRTCKAIGAVTVLYLGCISLAMALGYSNNGGDYNMMVSAYNTQACGISCPLN